MRFMFGTLLAFAALAPHATEALAIDASPSPTPASETWGIFSRKRIADVPKTVPANACPDCRSVSESVKGSARRMHEVSDQIRQKLNPAPVSSKPVPAPAESGLSGATKRPAELDEYLFCTLAPQSPAGGRQDTPWENYRANQAWMEHTEAHFQMPQGLLKCLYFRETNYRSDIIDGRKVSTAGAFSLAQFVRPAFSDLNRHFGADKLAAQNKSPAPVPPPLSEAALAAARKDPKQKSLVKRTALSVARSNSPVESTRKELATLVASLRAPGLNLTKATLNRGGALRNVTLPTKTERPNRDLERPEAVVSGATWLKYYYNMLFGDLPGKAAPAEMLRRYLLAGAAYNAGIGNFNKHCLADQSVLQCFRNLPGRLAETRGYIRSMQNCTKSGCQDSIVNGKAYDTRKLPNGKSCGGYKSIDGTGCPSGCGIFPKGKCESI